MSLALLASVVLASLAGSLHCAGMCGPFAAFWMNAGGAAARAHAAYHAARLITYAALGALAGLAGRALEAAAAGRLSSAAALAAGLVLIAWGTIALARQLGARLPLPRLAAAASRPFSRVLARLAVRPPAQRALVVGFATALLPCGWLHAFLVAAAGTGSPASGALLMTAFFIGTVPVFSALAVVGPLRRHAPRVAAVAVLLCGVVTLWHHARLVSAPVPCHDPDAASVARALAPGTAP